MTRTRLLVGLGIALLALSGVAVATRSPKDPKEAIRPADRALAQRIVLRQSDFASGWRAGRASGGTEQLRCPALGYDPDFSDLTLTGRAASRDFAQGTQLVAGGVEIYATAAQARALFKRSLARGFDRCLAQQLKSLASAGVRIEGVSVGKLSLPRVGELFVARRVRARFVGARAVRATLDFVAVGKGRASMSFQALGLGTAVSTSLEASLARKLAARAQT